MTTILEFYPMEIGDVPNEVNTTLDFLCGTELEIEEVQDHNPAKHLCNITVDHSLRNNGYEYIFGPLSKKESIARFKAIHEKLVLGKTPFSERTSIHVHVNCRTLHLDQVRQLVLTYALLEPLFFEFVGEERKNNIFCVPLSFTFLANTYKDPLNVMHKAWSKYAAFNICPLGPGKDGSACHGTIEFRHMYGTKDVNLYAKWITILEELHQFIARKAPDFNIIKYLLVNKDNIAQLARTVVPTLVEGMSDSKINSMCQDTLLDVKLSSGGLTK